MAGKAKIGAQCRTPQCSNYLTHTQTYLRLRKCDECRQRRWRGKSVQSDELWARRSDIVEVKGRVFFLRCAFAGCADTWPWSAARKDKMFCYWHCFEAHRTRFKFAWLGLQQSAKTRNILVTISFNDYRNLVDGTVCVYCLGPHGATEWRQRNSGVRRNSGIDRVDPSRGYTLGNLVPCCGPCNRGKCHRLSASEFLRTDKKPDYWMADSFTKTPGHAEWLIKRDKARCSKTHAKRRAISSAC